MHRTTTTAALLVTVALSALSGCVTVPRPATPAPPPDTVPALPTAPRPDGSVAPRVIQAPAQQALEMAGAPRRPKHRKPAAPRHTAEAAPTAPRPRAAEPAPPRPRAHREHPYRSPRTDTPGFSGPAPQTPDVCALGREYGGWQGDSPAARICEQTYGR
ncbi:hypothetical protein BIV25_42595 [Streptomyces sp. MUSC 14]|uniref:hypothetical protein n=1 Tax=Streptomyces sp. MUSC 14 TaxID=1354889 RepID=UPI0008F5BA3E|nr:hypothetical protein [Streptomyces sp. MUSC 14]OIJ85931.1 hypothetical protein BIV25_42595 [Streptomyces sp. MUSC 14]